PDGRLGKECDDARVLPVPSRLLASDHDVTARFGVQQIELPTFEPFRECSVVRRQDGRTSFDRFAILQSNEVDFTRLKSSARSQGNAYDGFLLIERSRRRDDDSRVHATGKNRDRTDYGEDASNSC